MAASTDPPPQRLRVGVHLFNAGEYFEQHEVLEELWRAEPGPVRELYQGILQIGVGLHHLERGNHHGAVTLLGRGIERLGRVPPDSHGLDVAALAVQAHHLRERLRELGPDRLGEVDRARYPTIVWRVPPP